MTPPGRFIILTPGFPRDEGDTTCIPSLQQFLLALRKVRPDLEVAVIAFQYPHDGGEYMWHGVKVTALGGANQGQWRRLRTWAGAWRRLRAWRRSGPILGVLSLWLGECALVGRFFCRRAGLPHFIWMSGQDARAENHYLKRINPEGKEIIAMSDFLKAELHRNFGIMAGCVINNGINEAAFAPLNLGPRPIDILGAGALSPLKNYSAFLRLARELKRMHPHLSGVIAGEGPERARLEGEIESLGLKENVRLLGSLPHAQVLELMNQAKVFLHPSTYEGNSSVLMEALCAGCHVASFCGLSDAGVENLVVCRDEPDMAATADGWLTSPALPAQRVVFNRMEDSALKILSLYAE